MTRWLARGRLIVSPDDPRPRIMGVVNVTPDSFSDGGRFVSPDEAASHALWLVSEGAHILDVGGESSRPGSDRVSQEEEARRVVPAIEAIVASGVSVPISVDTTKVEVARLALAAGASIINDITALGSDGDLARLIAETGAGVVLMHSRGDPRTMQNDPRYDDVVTEVHDFLARRADAAEAAGISRDRICLDPGIGFGKTFEHNCLLLRALDRFTGLGCALMIGTSRKGFLGTITGRPIDQRATASVVSSLAASLSGASVLRVHDVGAMSDALKVWESLRGWTP